MKGKELIENVKKDNNISRNLTGILDIIICLLLFISSIYKGAFYKSDFLFPNVAISFVGVVYLIYKIIKEIASKKDLKPKSRVRILLDIFMLLLPFAYVLPIVFKTYVSLPDSIYEMLRYVDMTIIYFLVKNSKNEKIYLNIFLIISVVQMILGIDQMTTRSFENFINDLSTGYLPDKDRLSGTLQYANITGIVIGLGLIYCFNKLAEILKKEDKLRYIEMIISVFIILLGVSCVVLTESRVATITIIGILLFDSIFNFICIRKRIGVYKIGLVIYSIFISGLLEKYILQSDKNKVYITVLLATLLFVFVIKLLGRLCFLLQKRVRNNDKLRKNKRKIIIFSTIIIFLIFYIIIFIPKNIVIEKLEDEENVIVSKNIYDFKTGENKIEFNVNSLKEDTRFKIVINSVNNGYKEEIIAAYNYYDNKSGKFFDKIIIPENTEKIVLTIEVQKGKLEFENFKINDDKIKLSYLLLPDEVLSKIQDTFHGVYGDELRLNYAKDTFKILKGSPWIGFGGEGFKYLYGSVQESSYISSEAHSAILQALVEVGIVGATILIGIILLSLCIVIKLLKRLNKLSEEDKNYVVLLVFIYLALLSMVIFDLAFSYAFMIYIFAIITALLLKKYLDIIDKYNERKKEKSRIDWSYIKIIVLSLSAVSLVYATYFSFNAYRASLIKVPNKGNDLTATEVSENIAYLELKNSQDKFDIDYMKELNNEYNKYKMMLTEAIVKAGNDKELVKELNEEQEKLLISIKNNADKMLEYEYYDKFVLNEVADVYLYNYINFVNIYREQFSSEEVAYTFYLNYVLKLADRIVELSPYSKKAYEIYNNMCEEYIEELEKDNKYLQSTAIENVIKEFKNRI